MIVCMFGIMLALWTMFNAREYISASAMYIVMISVGILYVLVDKIGGFE